MIRKLAPVIFALCFIGCWGGGNFTKIREPGKISTQIKSFSIAPIVRKNAIPDSVQDSVVSRLSLDFPAALKKKGLTQVDSLGDINLKILIEEIKPGDAGLRYMGGIWALLGKGKILVLVKTTDSTGQEIFSGEGEGTVTGGKWGGSILDASERLANAYADSLHLSSPGK